MGVVSPCPTKALARPLCAPLEEAPEESPKCGKKGNKESYGKIQGIVGEWCHEICGIPGNLARNHVGGSLMKGDLKQESEVT